MIKLQNIYAGYNGADVIKNINIEFTKGKVTSIIGPNGCGKSTLLKVASRLLEPYSGEAALDGVSYRKIKPRDFAKQVSILPQTRPVLPISAEALVSHGRFPHLTFPRKLSQTDRIIIADALERTGADKYKDKLLTQLSGGERQKVYIAMMISQSADYIFLDEPTTYLDINHQLEILGLINNLREMGKAVVIVMHDLHQAITNSDFICLMNEGAIADYGTKEDILDNCSIDKVFNITFRDIYGIISR